MECYITFVLIFRVIFSSTAEAVDSDDKEEYGEAKGGGYDWDDDDDDDIFVTQAWRHHPLGDLEPAGTVAHLIADNTRVFSWYLQRKYNWSFTLLQ